MAPASRVSSFTPVSSMNSASFNPFLSNNYHNHNNQQYANFESANYSYSTNNQSHVSSSNDNQSPSVFHNTRRISSLYEFMDHYQGSNAQTRQNTGDFTEKDKAMLQSLHMDKESLDLYNDIRNISKKDCPMFPKCD